MFRSRRMVLALTACALLAVAYWRGRAAKAAPETDPKVFLGHREDRELGR